MLDNARRANPLLPWRTVWMAAALIALPGAVAMVAILLATAPSGSGAAGGSPRAHQVAIADPACAQTSRPRVNSSRTGADSTLVPAGATSVLLCRYAPLTSLKLEREVLVSRQSVVAQLTTGLNALPPATGTYNCPSDNGAQITAVFSYPSGPPDPVSIGLEGCQSVTNGHVNRLAFGRPVIGQIAALIPPDGRLKGHLELCGGPAPGRCWVSGIGGSVGSTSSQVDRLAVFDRAGHEVADFRVRRGRFAGELPPGRYLLKLLADGRDVHGKVIQTTHVTIRSARTTRVVFHFAVP